ncbi:MAG TPA: hypothetical protein VHY34_10375 [Caulobacteraceae bacterium]|jgi:hypothetical protein|nr:hypothetical protein [Caulobacteraceae bacterium]
MLRYFLSRYITRFERQWSYDASYMRELLDLSPWAFIKFVLVSSLGHGPEAPPAAVVAAGLVGTLTEDCGPCTQISVDMAVAHGLSPAILQAILAGDTDAMGPDAALGYAFAKASLARDLEASDRLRDEVIRRWGKKGLTNLALILMASRTYPTLKYALGHGRACSKVVVAGVGAPVHRPEVLAV